MATMPRYPQEGSCDRRICSCPIVCIWANTSAVAADTCRDDRGARSLSSAETTAPSKPDRLPPRFLLVLIKSFPGLPAQKTCGNHLPQQGTRPVLVVAQTLVQHVHD